MLHEQFIRWLATLHKLDLLIMTMIVCVNMDCACIAKNLKCFQSVGLCAISCAQLSSDFQAPNEVV